MPSPAYLALLDEMRDLHIRKSTGYAGDNPDVWCNFRGTEGFGVPAPVGALIRASDKFLRVQSLIKNPAHEMVGEAIEDTLMDLAAYALITICLLREQAAPESKPYIPRTGQTPSER